MIAKFLTRFIAYGATPLPHTEPAIKEVAYCLDELKFHGMTITTVLQNGLSIAYECFAPFYAELNRRHAILYIHQKLMTPNVLCLAATTLTFVPRSELY